MKRVLLTRAVVAFAAALSIAACTSSDRTKESTGEYVDDTVITSKVKTALLSDSGLKSFDIGVETFKGVVQLSGFVSSSAAMSQAVRVAGGIKGVSSVRNDMRVK